jgi:hypothetical protein
MGLEHSLDTCSLKIGDGKGSLATLQCWSRGFPITTKLWCRPNWFPVLGNLADKLLNAKFNCSNDMRLSAAPERLFCRRDLNWFNLASSSGMLPSKSFTDNSRTIKEDKMPRVGEWSCHAHKMISWEDQLFQTLKLLQLWWNDTLQSIWWKIQKIEIGKVLKALRNWPILLICSSIKMAEWAAASNLHREFSGQIIVTQTHCKPSKACAQTEKPSCELVIGK